jgi:hypothetical protein
MGVVDRIGESIGKAVTKIADTILQKGQYSDQIVKDIDQAAIVSSLKPEDFETEVFKKGIEELKKRRGGTPAGIADWIRDIQETIGTPFYKAIMFLLLPSPEAPPEEIERTAGALTALFGEFILFVGVLDTVSSAFSTTLVRNLVHVFRLFAATFGFDRYLDAVVRPGLYASVIPQLDQLYSARYQSVILRPGEAVDAFFRGKLPPSDLASELAKQGYNEARQQMLVAVNRELLAERDLSVAFLRGEISEADLGAKLRARGYEEEDIATLKKLYWLIPGSTDLIRMAVREVFTPEIVERFGQMEDFPEVFATWAAKVGLSEEWAKNYWAAHWDLPSATQGFEMLHRGEITYEELQMLLRALDVMPFWRDKLIKIAYTPFTRVDVRRMHKAGVLDEAGVKQAYTDIGYDDEKATKMTEFVLAYNATTQEDPETEEIQWTRAEVLDAYKRGMNTEEETRSLLGALDISPERIDYYVRRYEVEKDKDLKAAYMARYKKLFVEGMISWPDVAEALAILGLTEAEITELEPLWEMERMVQVAHPSRADLDSFLKAGIIDDVLYREEMRKMGYSDMYIDWYLWRLILKEGD